MKCFICDNQSQFRPLFPFFCKTKNYICLECGLVFIPQDRNFVENYYESDGYFKKSPNLSLRKEFFSPTALVKQAIQRLKLMRDVDLPFGFKCKKILDVGCGYGELLYILNLRYSSEVLGLEPSLETANLGRNLFNIDIQAISLEKFNSDGKFDIILCNHTLEHVSDPVLFLNMLKGLLTEDGYIYIEIPNIMSPTGGFKLDKFLYHEHLQTFNSYNIAKLFDKVGLSIYSFSDKDFLRFVLRLKTDNLKSEFPPLITPKQVINFLSNYKKNYNIFKLFRVYVYKFNYLFKLIYYKLFKDSGFLK